MEYNFREIEAKWQAYWKAHQTYRVTEDPEKDKFYVLDMFPYPSGAGLHVGHPLGYIASDIMCRYKRLNGYNVLHPMGYDSFGLPAEQYAIDTGQHPEITTRENIARYRQQLDRIGFSYDWEREIKTSDPSYYKWTQWIFKQLYNSWYNQKSDKAEDIASLVAVFETDGNAAIQACGGEVDVFTPETWKGYGADKKDEIIAAYRLAFISDTWVNWCPQLGTVLANDEVKEGVSERGGYPVEQKLMKQWSLRITAYAQRLLDDLGGLEWTDAIKEVQRNWIGRSEGASVRFQLEDQNIDIEVFTTRPDTLFGVTFIVLAPEHEWVDKVTTAEYRKAVSAYRKTAAARSERDRMSDVKTVTGQFTGAYVLHPFTGKKVPVWIGDYVLTGYGTGAVMAVPGGDQRDWNFARTFDLEIIPLTEGQDPEKGADASKDKPLINSDMLNGMTGEEAIPVIIKAIEKKGIGKGKVNYRLRDAIFSRQRYWGEPFPVAYKNGKPYVLPDDRLPLNLPEVDQYLPTSDGEPPLARAQNWALENGDRLEYNTMPGWAGSSWYFLRFMDPKNDEEFVSKQKADYWGQVDLYIGGAEHATGHLLYARFWTKFLFDRGYIGFHEPFRKMINQGMILGNSSLVYRINGTQKFVSAGLRKDYETTALHVDVNMVENDVLDIDAFCAWREEYKDATFLLEDGKYYCGSEVEKMSKRWYNVINPDLICDRYGADSFRLYEMFLGPLEQYKPWDTKGINGVHNFLRKLWRLYHPKAAFEVCNDAAPKEALKTLHRTIKKVNDDINRHAYNTVVSGLMIGVNELTDLKCNHRDVLEPLVVLLSPYAPHIAEELWEKLGHKTSVTQARFPTLNESLLTEDTFSYPVSFNGKTRFKIELPANLSKEQIEARVLVAEEARKYMANTPPKRVIVVPKRIINIVV